MFINNTGALEFEGEDDIYIDCSPTGDSDNDVAFKLDANSSIDRFLLILASLIKFPILFKEELSLEFSSNSLDFISSKAI